MEKSQEKRTETEQKRRAREALTMTRAQAKLVAGLTERLRGLSRDGLRSARLDAAPRTGTKTYGLDAAMIRREETERILGRETALLHRMERRARKAMEGMKPEKYAFCALYYISAMSIEETAEAIERSVRQCMRYKREIEEEN